MGTDAGGRTGRVVFVLGKPPPGGSLVDQVIGALRRAGGEVRVHLPHDAVDPAPPWLQEADLLVQRGLRPDVLERLLALETAGTRCCNRVGATLTAQDRLALAAALAAADLPRPALRPAANWKGVLALTGRAATVVKARDASRGRGARVVVSADGSLPTAAPFDGPYVVEGFVPGVGIDRKLYVAGAAVRGLLKAGRGSARVQAARAFDPSAPHRDLALRAGRALGLEIYGVDVLEGPAGPVIVDVNPFPGFRGIDRGFALVADHLAGLAGLRPGRGSAEQPWGRSTGALQEG